MNFVSLQGVKPRFAIAGRRASYAGPTARSRQPPGLQLQKGFYYKHNGILHGPDK